MFPLKKRQIIRGCQEHIKAGLGCATDWEANYETLYMPFDGLVEQYHGDQGGDWLRVVRGNGDKIEFAHLSKYLIPPGFCKTGTPIAITGNSGTITSGPHLHCQIVRGGQRIDPESYFNSVHTFKVFNIIGGNVDVLQGFNFARNKLEEFSQGQLTLEISKNHIEPLYVPNKMIISDDEVEKALANVDIGDAQCIVVFYQHTMTRPWFSTQYIQNCPQVPIIKFPITQDIGSTLLFELGHALVLWYNEHRGSNPSISNVDNYDGGELIVKDKINRLMPYLSTFDDTSMPMEFIRATKDVYLVRNGQKSLIYNGKAFGLIGDWSNIKQVTQAELDALPSTGIALAGIEEE